MGAEYIVGETRAETARLLAGSVALVATSPPFIMLRSYLPADHPAKHLEMGSERTPAAYLDALLEVTAEWARVLAPWGSIAVELGDTYSGSGGGGGDYLPGGMRDGQAKFAGSAAGARESAAAHWRAKHPADHTPARDNRGGKNGRPSMVDKAGGGHHEGGPGWPLGKSLVMIPQLYAIALAYGINPITGTESPAGLWRVRNIIVWHRTNPAVGELADKVRPSTSYITVATKTRDRWFDLTAIRQPASKSTHHNRASADGTPRPRETDLRPLGVRRLPQVNSDPEGTSPPLDTWFDEYDGSHEVWTLNPNGSKLAHYAMWPAKLAQRLILSMCPEWVCSTCGQPRRRIEEADPSPHDEDAKALIRAERLNGPPPGPRTNHTGTTVGWSDCGHDTWRHGVVLDPFVGTGTTIAAADLLGRDGIGIDLDIGNAALYRARYDEVKRALFGTPIPDPNQATLFS